MEAQSDGRMQQTDHRGVAHFSAKRPDQARSHSQVRPLSVDEALQYTPLSSIVPFGPDFLPVPTVGCTNSTPLLTPEEHSTSRKWLSELDHQTSHYHNSSALVYHTVQDLQRLLEPNQFKSLRGLDVNDSGDVRFGGTSNPPVATQLGSFADMVLNSTRVAHRYPTPTTPSSRSNKVFTQSTHANGTPNFAQESQNKQFQLQNSKANPQKGSASGKSGTPVSSNGKGALQPMVVIPAPSKTFPYHEYETFPEEELSTSRTTNGIVSSKEKSIDLQGEEELQPRNVDQKEKSDASIRYFQELMSNIFEAEDQLQPDTSGQLSLDTAQIFLSTSLDHGEDPILAQATQLRVEQALQKVISDGRFSEVPTDTLVRLQKLCEGALRSAELVDVRIDDAWSDDDIEHWMQRIETIDTALKSSKILLRIMTGGRDEKQLYSEETMQALLNVLKTVLESCIIPVVEMRSVGARAAIFKAITSRKKPLVALVNQSSKVLQLLADLFIKGEVSDGAVTTVEFLASGIIFVENAHAERDSALGTQRFERLRIAAMDTLAKIFSKYPDQRTFIFDEILTSLERLPVMRQSARQFKLIEGGNIQLVSALIMRLIQASAANVDPESNKRERKRALPMPDSGTNNSDYDLSESEEEKTLLKASNTRFKPHDSQGEQDAAKAIQGLQDVSQPLLDGAQKNAHYVIQFLVSRALKSTKTGDDPYRVLLDIFVEDFISALPSTDWPAAEMLLRTSLTSMIGIAEGEKSSAPAKVMALDHLAMMGSSICDLGLQIRRAAGNIEMGNSSLDEYLTQVTNSFLAGTADEGDLVVWDGAYRATLEYLQERDLNDPQIQSARGYYTTLWASRLIAVMETAEVEQYNTESEDGPAQLASRIKLMIFDQCWLERESDFESVTTAQGRLAYALTLLNLPFGKAFERILLILLNSSNSDQATVRSKSLKTVIQLLEKDPSILDRGAYLIRLILKKASDSSSLVRDSALGLIGKCLTLKPTLWGELWEAVLQRSMDTVVGVRKRSMKILKEIYLQSTKQEIKSVIADALLHRMKDGDEGVSELARQMFEEVWISPFHNSAGSETASVQDRLAVKDQVLLIVRTIQRSDNVSAVLNSLLQSLLSSSSKNKEINFRVCKTMVSVMFDEVIDEEDQPGKPGRHAVLQTLTVFAKANANLFAAEQLELLHPYIEHLSKNDDLNVYRSVIIIYRWVLPYVKNLKDSFLAGLQKTLLGSITVLLKRELNEVIACLWTINGMLKNIERLSRVTISCMKAIYSAQNENLMKDDKGPLVSRITRFLTIAGLFGKYCDFGADLARFKKELPWMKSDSVPGFMVTTFAPYTTPRQPLIVRRAALESLGLICQSWPKHFLNEQVCTAFEFVFDERNRDLEYLVLTGFKDFLTLEEARSEETETTDSGDAALGAGRLGGAIATNQEDGVTASIAQRYLHQAIRVGLATQDAYALTAVEVIAGVSRQGLVHPKECAPVLVALETSTNTTIATLAFREHRTLHQKHETIVEKEYMRAVRQAFDYQKNVVGDVRGATTRPFCSKLHSLFDVIKISKGKIRRKFLANLCNKIDFDSSNLDVTAGIPPHLEFSRFIIENLAFFEYNSVDELVHVISCMERVVTSTGTSVAHGIESEILKSRMQSSGQQDGHNPEQITVTVCGPDISRLKQLTTASMILSALWIVRTYLRRLYGLNKEMKQKESKAKLSTKELNRAPVRVSGVAGDKVWEQIEETMAALVDSNAMMSQSQRFVEILSIDHELKVVVEDEDDDEMIADMKAQTPSEDDADGTPGPPNGSGKGRKRKIRSETPAKKGGKKRRASSKVKRKSIESEDETFFG
ncbi:MAG: Sister chromatid cohesion protein 2 [Sclerophora amabilis]|nr:MAG: Sister chromatid cohesion protein 2 [Sclerophora amabilis]